MHFKSSYRVQLNNSLLKIEFYSLDFCPGDWLDVWLDYVDLKLTQPKFGLGLGLGLAIFVSKDTLQTKAKFSDKKH